MGVNSELTRHYAHATKVNAAKERLRARRITIRSRGHAAEALPRPAMIRPIERMSRSMGLSAGTAQDVAGPRPAPDMSAEARWFRLVTAGTTMGNVIRFTAVHQEAVVGVDDEQGVVPHGVLVHEVQDAAE
jgi:hypothetical protein